MRFVVIRGPEPAGPFELEPGPNVLGRDATANIRLPSRRVSRRHAVAILGPDGVLLRDLDSANGIVDESGRRQPDITVRPGQRVQVGDFVLRLEGVNTGDLELELDDPLTAEDDLVLDNDHEDTPLPQGPMPVMRPALRNAAVPDPGSATLNPVPSPPFGPPPLRDRSRGGAARPAPAAPPPAAPAAAPPPAAPVRPAAPPPAAPAPRVAPPPPPPTPAGTSRPQLPPLADHPTTETSARMPPPVLPFGPPSGGFAAPPPPPPPMAPPEDRTPLSTPPPAPLPPPDAPPPFVPYADDPHTASDAGQQSSTRHAPIRRPSAEAPPLAGLPWLAQVAGLLVFTAALVLCAPVGGLFSQVSNTLGVAEELSLQRGEALAEGLANRNGEPVAAQRFISLDAASVLQYTGVRQAALTDATGTVLAPPERARQSLVRSPAFAEAQKSGTLARAEGADGTWEIVAPIRAEAASGAGARTIAGWAWIAYDPAVTANEAASPILRGLAALVVVFTALLVLLAGGWWLVLRPLAALRDETEHALLDHVDRVVSSVRWAALDDLASSINRVLQRARDR